MDKERQYSVCTMPKKRQHLRHTSSHDIGAPWGLRQRRGGGRETTTNPEESGTSSHGRWLTYSSVTLHIQEYRFEEFRNKIITSKAHMRTRRFSSIPHWKTTYCVFTIEFASGMITKMLVPTPRTSEEEEEIDLDPEQLTLLRKKSGTCHKLVEHQDSGAVLPPQSSSCGRPQAQT